MLCNAMITIVSQYCFEIFFPCIDYFLSFNKKTYLLLWFLTLSECFREKETRLVFKTPKVLATEVLILDEM